MTEREYGLGQGKVYPASAARHLLNPARRLVQPASLAARASGVRPGDRVLELGCGPGYFSPSLARRVPGGRLVLFDLQPEMLHHARRRMRGAAADAVCGDGTMLPFAEGVFDVVFVSAVLGEIPDRDAALSEARGVLCDGGRLVILETFGDPDRIPAGELTRLVTSSGFEAERRRRVGWSYLAAFTRVV